MFKCQSNSETDIFFPPSLHACVFHFWCVTPIVDLPLTGLHCVGKQLEREHRVVFNTDCLPLLEKIHYINNVKEFMKL